MPWWLHSSWPALPWRPMLTPQVVAAGEAGAVGGEEAAAVRRPEVAGEVRAPEVAEVGAIAPRQAVAVPAECTGQQQQGGFPYQRCSQHQRQQRQRRPQCQRQCRRRLLQQRLGQRLSPGGPGSGRWHCRCRDLRSDRFDGEHRSRRLRAGELWRHGLSAMRWHLVRATGTAIRRSSPAVLIRRSGPRSARPASARTAFRPG